jgi:predicted MFS family arabinose efflux permease
MLTGKWLLASSYLLLMPMIDAICTTDIVPLQDFALWRSLIVCVQAIGDVTGGPVGSALADKLGWHG